MFDLDIEKWVPRYIYQDKNGYALAKAIESALNIMNGVIYSGISLINDYDNMPEWRLDEIAWEIGCPYEYSADIDKKREWIRNANDVYKYHGTVRSIIDYMKVYFESVEIQESWEYSGTPYHFMMILNGDLNQKNVDWISSSINTAKNTRSILDKIKVICTEKESTVYTGITLKQFKKYSTGTGTIIDPISDIDYFVDENGSLLLDNDGTVFILKEV